MKKIIKTILLFTVGIAASFTTMAKQGLSLDINYNIAKPLGSSFTDYINKTSYRGFGGAIMYGLTNRLKVGVQSNYNDFYSKANGNVYEASDSSQVSAVVSNSHEAHRC